jgi:hypothetical protein
MGIHNSRRLQFEHATLMAEGVIGIMGLIIGTLGKTFIGLI